MAVFHPHERLEPFRRSALVEAIEAGAQPGRALSGLPEMVGSHEGQKVTLNRENGRDRPKQSCYYAAL
jgi:hypothetical protein